MRARHNGQHGFLLLEILIAVLVIGLALFAAVGVQTEVLRAAGDSKQRSKAMALAQANLETARNVITESAFTAMSSGNCTSVTATGFTVACTVSTPSGGLDQRLVQVDVSWSDPRGDTQRVALNSLVGLSNSATLVAGRVNGSAPAISPLGKAQKGQGSYSPIPTGATDNGNGTFTYRKADGQIELIASNGTILLYIPKTTENDPSFTTISGRILFDQSVNSNQLPQANHVRVRLSSEGVCIYNNVHNDLIAISGGSNSYKYFAYTCYVGEAWYGNVGVAVDDSVTGQAAGPTVCVGDPQYHQGVGDGTVTSAHPRESDVRVYRGFKSFSGSYLSTGVGNGRSYPMDGAPKPSAFPTYYGSVASGSDAFHHDFLLTRITGNGSCSARMTGGVFLYNAGRYLCLAPDSDPAADQCPNVWPNFESEAGGSGGSVNFTLAVTKDGTGSGTVASTPSGVDCGATCNVSFASGTSVSLTATPAAGSTFAGWSGACSGTGTCTITMSAATSVNATFTQQATSYSFAVSKSGTGAGTVTSQDGGINCGSTCSTSYASGASVTLTAAPATGSTFTGWGGACAGTATTCTVSVAAATSVSAQFTAAASGFTLNVSTAGTGVGTVTSSPSGISCSSNAGSCSAVLSGSVTLTAAAGSSYTFAGWTGDCASAGTNASCTVSMTAARSVGATFNAQNCSTVISGSRLDKNHDVRVLVPVSGYSCLGAGGNSVGYSCTGTVPLGSTVQLQEYRTQGQTTTIYSNLSVTVTPNASGGCPASLGNNNFP